MSNDRRTLEAAAVTAWNFLMDHAKKTANSPDSPAMRELFKICAAIRALPAESNAGETPETDALKRKWSAREGARNSTCSPEAHEIYELAEALERQRNAAQEELDAAWEVLAAAEMPSTDHICDSIEVLVREHDAARGADQEETKEDIPEFKPTHCCPECGTWGEFHEKSCAYRGTGMKHHVAFNREYAAIKKGLT